MFLGIRTVIYPTTDMDAARSAFTKVLSIDPYFDEPFYAAFQPGGFELGLDPNADPAAGPITYWGVANLDEAITALVATGGGIASPVLEPGDDIRMATLTMPGIEGVVGLIENPHFEAVPVPSSGPGL